MSDEIAERNEAIDWLQNERSDLDEEIGNQPFSNDFKVTALINEYKLPENDITATMENPSLQQGRDHMNKSNLWVF